MVVNTNHVKTSICNHLELPNTLKYVLLNPESRIPASNLTKLENELIDLAINNEEFLIEPEFWINNTQYNPMIHAYESGKKAHLVLKGYNCFSFSIRKRSSNGSIGRVMPGEHFRTHALVCLDT